jgi:hypothetical protein
MVAGLGHGIGMQVMNFWTSLSLNAILGIYTTSYGITSFGCFKNGSIIS